MSIENVSFLVQDSGQIYMFTFFVFSTFLEAREEIDFSRSTIVLKNVKSVNQQTSATWEI